MEVIAGYTIIEQLHRGAKSVVFRAKQAHNGNPVIIKTFHTSQLTQKDIAKIRREFEIGKTFTCEGIIQYHDLAHHDNRPVLITEDFGAVSLKDIRSHGELSIERFLHIAIQLADILDQIHSNNVIHRDIKPKNIVVNPETNQVKVIDFGISTRADIGEQIEHISDVAEGTLHYISPEQTGRMNRKVDYRTDFYSLGVTFYEILTGTYPFKTNDELELIHCHIAKIPESPSDRNLFIPEMLSKIIMKLMAKPAEDRYQSAKGLKRDLEICQQQWLETKKIQSFTLGEFDERSRFQIPQKLYGRIDELAKLSALFHQMTQGKRALAKVTGAPGVGKTAIINDIRKSLGEFRGNFISGKFDQLQRNIPYLGFSRAFGFIIKQFLTRSDDENEVFKQILHEKVGANIRAIADVIPELEILIGETSPLPQLTPLEAQNRFNLVFEQFVSCFATKEHPLVLFLDDVQWADAASLSLLESLLVNSELTYFMVILAYRDVEEKMSLNMDTVFKTINETGELLKLHLDLKPLKVDDLKELIADTLYTKPAEVESLAELVLAKTNGNPFFVNEFLKTLYEKQLLVYQTDTDRWAWNIHAIKTQSITDNVVDLMSDKMKNLPVQTIQVLKLAASIGNQFDSKTLSIISGIQPNRVLSILLETLRDGLIISITEGFSDITWIGEDESVAYHFRFLHDRVQHAAYSLVEEESRSKVHYQIGKLLLENLSVDELEDNLFDIVNHFIIGKDQIQDQERIQFVELFYRAADKAKQSTAYQSARKIFDAARNLMIDSDWKSYYKLAYQVYLQSAETTYLSGDFELAEQLFQSTLIQSQNNLDKATVYITRIVLYMNMNRYDEVAALGVEGARLLGVNLPKKANKLHLLPDLISLLSKIRGKDILAMEHREELNNPEKEALLKILENAIPGAYITDQDLMALMVLKAIQISLKHGFSTSTTFAFATFGLMLGSGFGDYKSGQQFGELAVRLSDRFNETANKAKIYQLYANFINHWTHPIHTDLPYLYKSLDFAKQSGDFVYAGLDAFIDVNTQFILGEQLPDLIKRNEEYITFTQRIKMMDAHNTSLFFNQIFKRLVDPGLHYDDLNASDFNEKAHLEFILAGTNKIAVQIYYMYKMIVSVLFRDFEKAQEYGFSSQQLILAPIGQLISAEHLFFYGLTASGAQQPKLRILKRSIRKFKTFTKFAPENFQHKYELLCAELARLQKNSLKATSLYEQAIESADKQGLVHIKALANELAGRHQLNLGNKSIAEMYLQRSFAQYMAWGAQAKIHQLKREFDFLQQQRDLRFTPQDENSTTIQVTTSESTDSIDITTVIRASQSISGEIELERLLDKMMRLMLENAGAQHGALLLADDQKLSLQAESIDASEIRIGNNLALEDSKHVAISVVQYVQKTKQFVVLVNAEREGIFAQDTYIQKNQVRSVMCSPVMHQGKLKAIIYLENNLTTGAFTEERLKVVNLLSSQLAVSLENALLYEDQKRLNEELKNEIAERKRSEEERIKAITESLRKTEELENARKFQLSLLPKSPPKLPNYEIAAFLKTATEVGGDYYDFFVTNPHEFTSIIGDATGHGLSAGMMVGMTKSALNSLQIEQLSPAEMLMRLNTAIKKANPGRLKMALNIARFSQDTVTFSSAAMPPVYHYVATENAVKELIVPGLPLGSPMLNSFENITFHMQNGDLLIGVSDGLPERKNYDGEELGYPAILEHIASNKDKSVHEIMNSLNDLGNKWSQGLANDDDITILVIKRTA